MENPIYYLQLNLQWVKHRSNTIQATYFNGLNRIVREFVVGDVIPTVIDITEEE